MKLLITGGNGFIARNLVEQLHEYQILSPNSKELDLTNQYTVLEYLKKNKFDVIIHTATYDAAPKHSTKDPAKVLENNLKMFFNIVRGKDYFGKMIYFGSGAEYGREHWTPKMKEDYFDVHVPLDQYGYSKYIMTRYALSNSNIYNLRLFAVFGKYEDWRVRVISSICHDIVMNQPIHIEQNKYYDFLYIDDLARIVRWFITNKPQQKVYNVCTGQTVDFITLSRKILSISRKKLEIIIKNSVLGLEYSGDNSLLLKELMDFKFSSINDSLKALYRWYEHS